MEELLNCQEVARVLCVSQSAIRSWVFHKRIPFLKLGGLIRFRQADIAQIQKEGLPSDEE